MCQLISFSCVFPYLYKTPPELTPANLDTQLLNESLVGSDAILLGLEVSDDGVNECLCFGLPHYVEPAIKSWANYGDLELKHTMH